MVRTSRFRVWGRIIAVLAVFGAITLALAWWHLIHWRPERAAYPLQGVEIGAADGEVSWRSVKAIGADFAYIDASDGAGARDPLFVRNLEAARAGGIKVGAVHRYDPCQPAERQSANFVTTVPRDPAMLPPAVELDRLADACPQPVSDAKVESELMTFLNQVETHTGRPTVLKITQGFEARYAMAARIDRNLWLVSPRLEPVYAGKPWALWTANDHLANEISERPLRWIAAHP